MKGYMIGITELGIYFATSAIIRHHFTALKDINAICISHEHGDHISVTVRCRLHSSHAHSSTPPRGLTLGTRHVHDLVAHRVESGRLEGLGKEVRQIISRANKRHYNLVGFDEFAYKVVSPIDVLGPSMIFGVVRRVNRSLIIV